MNHALFMKKLARARRIHMGGLMVAAGLRLAALGMVALLLAGLMDLVFAFEERTRLVILSLFCLVLAALAVYRLITILGARRKTIALWIDSRLGSRRRPVLTALELGGHEESQPGSEMAQFLVSAARERGVRALDSLTWRRILPVDGLRSAGFWVAGISAGLAVLFFVWSDPARIHLARLLHPLQDTPPWSRIQFQITPENPRVVYGEDLEISATVAGPFQDRSIQFIMRAGGHTYRSTCFREGPDRFVHRLDHVIQPAEFCISTGRARSPWYRVDVLMQPKIASVHVGLTPPEYSGLPGRAFYLGSEPLSGLRGSKVVLQLQSNRPLRAGAIEMKRSDGSVDTIDGQVDGTQQIRFEWAIEGDAQATIRVEDLLGTPNVRGHTFTQKLLDDEPPVVRIEDPPNYLLATPDSVVTVRAVAEDEYGLRFVRLLRSLGGYRDRELPVGIGIGARDARIEQPIDLGQLGLESGQHIELFMEAADRNPDMRGVSMSEIVRIDIISNDQYAEILRTRNLVADFSRRFAVAREQQAGLRAALAGLAERKDASDAERMTAVARVMTAWEELREVYLRLENDFSIYDLEQDLVDTIREIRETSEPHAERLAFQPPPKPAAPDLAQHWLDALAGPAEELERLEADAVELQLLTEVLRAAVQFNAILQRQDLIVRLLSRYEPALNAMPELALESARQRQAEGKTMFGAWLVEMDRLSEALPESQSELSAQMKELTRLLREAGVESLMAKAEQAAIARNGPETYQFAKQALDALNSVRNQCEQEGNGFSEMCRNPGQGFDVQPGRAETLAQLCSSLLNQSMGQGGLQGNGLLGGDPKSGYWMRGSTPLNVPMLGPERSSFANRQDGTATGRGRNIPGPGGVDALQSSETMVTTPGAPASSQNIRIEQFPERYRDAARIFYGMDPIMQEDVTP